MKMHNIKHNDISAGYTAYNGRVFTQAEAEGYNVYNKEIRRAVVLRDEGLIDSLSQRRHQYFNLVIGA